MAVEEFARGAVAVRTENVPLRPNRGIFDHLFAPAIAVQRRHAAQARSIKDAQAVTSCSVSGSMCPGIIIGEFIICCHLYASRPIATVHDPIFCKS